MKLNNPNRLGSSGTGTFINKNRKNKIRGTLIEADIFNPSDKDLTQVYTAIRNLYTNADNDLKNYLENKVSIESSKFFEEIKNIKEVDEYLENQITEVKNKINKEITDRKKTDTTLQKQINTVNQKINQEIIDIKKSVNHLDEIINIIMADI